jgi:hypothetical protein
MAVILPYAAGMSAPGLPYRGHAPVTWDTKTLAGIMADRALNPDRYAPSAKAYFCDVQNGDGIATITALNNVQWTTINVAGTVNANPGGGFDAATDYYTTPIAGIYFCQALVRLHEGFGTSTNVGIGIHTSNDDGYWFQWNKYVSGGGGRCSLDYTRIASFPQGAPLRLYAWQESGFTMNVTRASMQIFRIG